VKQQRGAALLRAVTHAKQPISCSCGCSEATTTTTTAVVVVVVASLQPQLQLTKQPLGHKARDKSGFEPLA